MDTKVIEDIFAPVGSVKIRRMFGGSGVYRGELCVALSYDGSIWLKTDDQTRDFFERAGSRAFEYRKRQGSVSVMSFWLIPEICFDDEDELKRFLTLTQEAAKRASTRNCTKSKKSSL